MARPAPNRTTGASGPLPLMETPVIAALMAFISGLINAWAFHNTSAFATVISGNLLAMTYRLSRQEWLIAAGLAATVLCFGLGSLTAGLAKARAAKDGGRYTPLMLAMIGFIFILTLTLTAHTRLTPHATLLLLCFAAGMQGNAFHYDAGNLYSSVSGTALTQRAFDYLAQAIAQRHQPSEGTTTLRMTMFFSLIGAFAAGALLGFLMDQHISNGLSLVVAAAVVCSLALYTSLSPLPVDPPSEAAS